MLEKIFKPLLYVLRNQKKYIFMTLLSALVFAFLIFPYGDLSDLITDLITKNSNSQVFVQFDGLGVGFLPPSLKMSRVAVDTPFLPTIKAGALYLAPSLSFLAFSPGFTAAIENVMSGNIDLSYRAGKKINDQTRMQKISLEFEKIDLKILTKFASLPVDVEGLLSADLSADFDPALIEQPDGEYLVTLMALHLPATTVATPLGPHNLPDMKLNGIKLKGTIKNAQFTIQEGTIGAAGDFIAGNVTGKVGVRFIRSGNRVVPEWSNYDLSIDMNFDRSAEKNFGIFLGFIDKYKQLTGTGSRYALNVSAPNFQAPPTLGPYRKN